MIDVTRQFDATPEAVFAVLADPYTYPRWVVGAQRIRKVEGAWPEVGAAFHHVVGGGPLRRRDSTEVMSVERDTLLVIEARARPAGRARVKFDLHAAGPAGTRMVMGEEAIRGPARLIPEPLLAPFVVARNRETLRRLEAVVAGDR